MRLEGGIRGRARIGQKLQREELAGCNADISGVDHYMHCEGPRSAGKGAWSGLFNMRTEGMEVVGRAASGVRPERGGQRHSNGGGGGVQLESQQLRRR